MAVALPSSSSSILKANSLCPLPIQSLNQRRVSIQFSRYTISAPLQISCKRIIPHIVCKSSKALSAHLAKYTKRAYVSVHDTTNLGFVARRLRSLGYNIFADPESAAALHTLGVIVTELHPFEDLFRFFDKRDGKPHIDRNDNYDVLVVNSPRGVGDKIDWLSLAKENKDALVVVDPQDYFSLLAHLEAEDLEDDKFRRILDLKVSQYEDDLKVSNHVTEAKRSFPGYVRSIATAIQLHGNEMSSKSYLDANVAWNWVSKFVTPTCVAMSHMYPCGAASRDDILEAHKLAIQGSHFGGPFGGVVTFNVEVDEALARQIREFVVPLEDKLDYEVVVAPSYTDKAFEILCGISEQLTVLQAKINKKEADELFVDDIKFRSVAEKCPTKMELDDVRFAWLCVKHSGMNFAVAKNKWMLGTGTWAEIAPLEQGLRKAIGDSGKEAKGAVLASDLFYPSVRMDVLQNACESGVSVIVGSSFGRIKDEAAIKRCNKYGVSLVFAEEISESS